MLIYFLNEVLNWDTFKSFEEKKSIFDKCSNLYFGLNEIQILNGL